MRSPRRLCHCPLCTTGDANLEDAYNWSAEGRPLLAQEDIEVKAEEILNYADPDSLSGARATRLDSVLGRFAENHGVKWFRDCDLGLSPNGKKLIGRCRPLGLEIFTDASITKNAERLRFTSAHEFGHLVFHRRLSISREEYDEMEDAEEDIEWHRDKTHLSTIRDWLEWQANALASALIMPRRTFQQALIEVQREREITHNVGIVLSSPRFLSQL